MNQDVGVIELVTRVAPVIVVIVGWIVVNYQNNKREIRKERRKAADEAKSIIREIYQSAVIYYTKAERDQEQKIKNLLDELEIELQRIPERGQNTSGMKGLIFRLNDLRDTITLDPFESAALCPLLPDDDIIRSIALSKNQLIAEIEDNFANTTQFCRIVCSGNSD